MSLVCATRPLGGRHRGESTTVSDLLTHPVVVASVVGLIVNDHWAKQHVPSWVTGKASDALGAIVLTALGIALAIVAGRHHGLTTAPNRPLAAGVAAVVVAAVAAVKTSTVGATVGGALLGVAGWPLARLGALLGGQALPGPKVATIVVDPYDALVALAGFTVVALIRAERPTRPQRLTAAEGLT